MLTHKNTHPCGVMTSWEMSCGGGVGGRTCLFSKDPIPTLKEEVFNESITIEGKICHWQHQAAAGFSLQAVVSCMCQLVSDLSQETSKGRSWRRTHALMFHSFLRQNKTKTETKLKKATPPRQLLLLFVELLLHFSETEGSQR